MLARSIAPPAVVMLAPELIEIVPATVALNAALPVNEEAPLKVRLVKAPLSAITKLFAKPLARLPVKATVSKFAAGVGNIDSGRKGTDSAARDRQGLCAGSRNIGVISSGPGSRVEHKLVRGARAADRGLLIGGEDQVECRDSVGERPATSVLRAAHRAIASPTELFVGFGAPIASDVARANLSAAAIHWCQFRRDIPLLRPGPKRDAAAKDQRSQNRKTDDHTSAAVARGRLALQWRARSTAIRRDSPDSPFVGVPA